MLLKYSWFLDPFSNTYLLAKFKPISYKKEKYWINVLNLLTISSKMPIFTLIHEARSFFNNLKNLLFDTALIDLNFDTYYCIVCPVINLQICQFVNKFDYFTGTVEGPKLEGRGHTSNRLSIPVSVLFSIWAISSSVSTNLKYTFIKMSSVINMF